MLVCFCLFYLDKCNIFCVQSFDALFSTIKILYYPCNCINHLMLYSLLHSGGTCEAWLDGVEGSQVANQKRSRFGADLFGSLSCTLQHGRFRNKFGDLTRVDARLDIASASAVAKGVASLFSSAQSSQPSNELCSPRLNIIFQQQVSYIMHKLIWTRIY